MKNHKFQQVRVQVFTEGQNVRFEAQTNKEYARIKGVFACLPIERVVAGTTLELKVNNIEVFSEGHDIRLLTSGQEVKPNDRFFEFSEVIEAEGSTISGVVSDPQPIPQGTATPPVSYTPIEFHPYEVVLYLWLTNEELK